MKHFKPTQLADNEYIAGESPDLRFSEPLDRLLDGMLSLHLAQDSTGRKSLKPLSNCC